MKTLKILILAILTILVFQNSYSQQDSISKIIIFRKDTLTTGNYYKFDIKLSNSLDGKLLSLKGNNLIIFTDKDIVNIDTADIVNIIRPSGFDKEIEITKNRRAFFYLGIGYTSKSPSGSSHKYFNGYNIDAKILYTFSKTLGLRFDLDYYYFKRDESTYTTSDFAGVHRTYKYYSGEVNAYLFKTCLIYGNLNPEETIEYYFYPALGMGTANVSSRYDTYMSGSNVPIIPTSDEKNSEICIGASLGIGMNAKLSKSIRGFAEVQFNGWFMGSKGPPTFFAVNLGIVL